MFLQRSFLSAIMEFQGSFEAHLVGGSTAVRRRAWFSEVFKLVGVFEGMWLVCLVVVLVVGEGGGFGWRVSVRGMNG